MSTEEIVRLSRELEKITVNEGLQLLADLFPGGLVFSTSFGLEDQVLLDLIATERLPVHVFTLDTGRLFPETYSLWSRSLERYKLPIKAYYPDASKLGNFISQKGPNNFYESIENRKACCAIRKMEPLERALKGYKIWVTGIRASQSANRQDFPVLEWDERHHLLKFHPLLNWNDEEVRGYIDQNQVPYNVLYDKGFPSIGCAPCTRAVQPGNDPRSGRWWWEETGKRECGLHVQ